MASTFPAQRTPPSQAATEAHLAIRRVALIAMLAIAFGFLMQALILTAKLLGGAAFPGVLLLVDLAQGVTWAFLVCLGVGIGTSILKARALLAGIIAALFAPISLAIAKSSQKVMATVLGAADQPALLPLATISVLRAIEYGILGWLLAKLTQKDVTKPMPYLGAGTAIGATFGLAISWLTYQAAVANGVSPGPPQIAATLLNEVVFPIGCAFLIYVGQSVGRSLKLVGEPSLT
ncbi:hypothetical protein [Chelativorans sp.]|uniref:hypothetical protein n=1 Tax=Chelativorans sp. TaxID=2203393 RepID=UPI00281271D9|nr:hypothetical protein [Chelativorans sp.]